MKPGYKTTELYITIATQVIALFVAYGLMDNARAEQWNQLAASLIAVLPTIVYTINRTYLKSKQ